MLRDLLPSAFSIIGFFIPATVFAVIISQFICKYLLRFYAMRISFNSKAFTPIISARLKTEDILIMHHDYDDQVLLQPRPPGEQLRGAAICEETSQGWRCQRVRFIVPDTGLFAESPADNRVRR